MYVRMAVDEWFDTARGRTASLLTRWESAAVERVAQLAGRSAAVTSELGVRIACLADTAGDTAARVARTAAAAADTAQDVADAVVQRSENLSDHIAKAGDLPPRH